MSRLDQSRNQPLPNHSGSTRQKYSHAITVGDENRAVQFETRRGVIGGASVLASRNNVLPASCRQITLFLFYYFSLPTSKF